MIISSSNWMIELYFDLSFCHSIRCHISTQFIIKLYCLKNLILFIIKVAIVCVIYVVANILTEAV